MQLDLSSSSKSLWRGWSSLAKKGKCLSAKFSSNPVYVGMFGQFHVFVYVGIRCTDIDKMYVTPGEVSLSLTVCERQDVTQHVHTCIPLTGFPAGYPKGWTTRLSRTADSAKPKHQQAVAVLGWGTALLTAGDIQRGLIQGTTTSRSFLGRGNMQKNLP